MRTPNLFFISTTDAAGARHADLVRMIQSIDAFALTSVAKVTLLLLAQRLGSDAAYGEDFPPFVDMTRAPERLSLSVARNRQIERLLASGAVAADDIILFPDDDCWYPPETLASVLSAFQASDDIDLWFCLYASSPERRAPTGVRATTARVARRASSNTIAIRARLLIDGLRFDEDLGLGALHNGGEDTCFALAALGRARKSVFVESPLVGHRDGDPSFAVRYYRGALLAIARNRNLRGGRRELARKIAVGAYHVCARRMPLREYFETLRIVYRDM